MFESCGFIFCVLQVVGSELYVCVVRQQRFLGKSLFDIVVYAAL